MTHHRLHRTMPGATRGRKVPVKLPAFALVHLEPSQFCATRMVCTQTFIPLNETADQSPHRRSDVEAIAGIEMVDYSDRLVFLIGFWLETAAEVLQKNRSAREVCTSINECESSGTLGRTGDGNNRKLWERQPRQNIRMCSGQSVQYIRNHGAVQLHDDSLAWSEVASGNGAGDARTFTRSRQRVHAAMYASNRSCGPFSRSFANSSEERMGSSSTTSAPRRISVGQREKWREYRLRRRGCRRRSTK
jgi:hypothetical protein